jgi:hypothetical protein
VSRSSHSALALTLSRPPSRPAGDWHTAYLNFYRLKRDSDPPEEAKKGPKKLM